MITVTDQLTLLKRKWISLCDPLLELWELTKYYFKIRRHDSNAVNQEEKKFWGNNL